MHTDPNPSLTDCQKSDKKAQVKFCYKMVLTLTLHLALNQIDRNQTDESRM